MGVGDRIREDTMSALDWFFIGLLVGFVFGIILASIVLEGGK